MVGTKLLIEANKIKQDIINLRRKIHMYPELAMEEHNTANIVEGTLNLLGIETKRVFGTGVIGLLKGKGPGKTVALRADMDALPILDKKTVEYASKISGKMHACGHDAHTAMLLGAAMLLSKFKDQFKGNIKFLFQPAEEGTGGALPMIEEGVMEAPKVDAVFGLHVSPTIETGKIGIRYGSMFAAADTFDVTIYGKGSHGACPHEGVDAIAVGAQVITALQNFISRQVDPVDSAVVTVGTFHGGTQRNVVAHNVKFSGIVRTINPDTRKNAIENLKNIISGISESLGAKVEMNFDASYPALINDIEMTDLVKNVSENLIGQDKLIVIDKPSLATEDFAYYVQKAPGSFFMLGVKNIEKGIVHPAHNGLFDIDEDSLPLGAAMHTQIALNFLR